MSTQVTGEIEAIVGAIIDVKFSIGQTPKVYDALIVEESELVLEVQQQIGDNVARTIAMGATDGLKRGMKVLGTGGPIEVPVGQPMLGRIVDVLGSPIDEKEPIEGAEKLPIHREPPKFVDLAVSQELLETGIKVIDLLCPFAKGGKVGLFGGAGVGKTVNMLELIQISQFNTAVTLYLQVLEKELEKEMTSTMK